jgi:hypothetical protein
MHTPSSRHTTKTRCSVAAFAAVTCTVLLAACGSSDPPSNADPTGGPLLKYAQCMRANGVPNFPDPRASGGLFIPNDIDTQSPAFKSAQQACAKLEQANTGSSRLSNGRKLQLLTLARCVRAHGVPNFPDPTSSPPPNTSSGIVIGGNGWYLALGTAQERQSPAYKQAASACGGTTP